VRGRRTHPYCCCVTGLCWRLKETRTGYAGALRVLDEYVATDASLMMLCSVLLAVQTRTSNVGARSKWTKCVAAGHPW
jgi:hypothetical protein